MALCVHSNLVSCFQEELTRALAELTSPSASDATEATAPTLQALAAAMVLLRRCRVNAALTIQLFSHLFHYINAVCFNKVPVIRPVPESNLYGSTCWNKPSTTRRPIQARKPSSQASNATHTQCLQYDAHFVPIP